jgi:hypothetical protein
VISCQHFYFFTGMCKEGLGIAVDDEIWAFGEIAWGLEV